MLPQPLLLHTDAGEQSLAPAHTTVLPPAQGTALASAQNTAPVSGSAPASPPVPELTSTDTPEDRPEDRPVVTNSPAVNSEQHADVTGPPVVILHGLFGDSGNWKQQASLLRQHRTVVCMDLRNHGLSPHTEDMSFTTMAADVVATLDHYRIDRCDLIGHSLGGKTGMQIATDHPDRINRLVTVDIAPVDYPPHHQIIIDNLQALNLATLAQRREADKALSDTIAEPAVRQFLLKGLVRQQPTRPASNAWRWRFNLSAIAACYPALCAPPELGSPFTGPHLVIAGGRSDYVTQNNRQSFESVLPNTRFVDIPKAGHWPHSSHPELFFEQTLRFLTASL